VSRLDLAFLLYRSHFCARHRLIAATGYGPLAATYAWRGMSSAARAPWAAAAKTAEVRAQDAADEASAQMKDHLLAFLRVRRLVYAGELRVTLDALIASVEAEELP
jgi:hypothetical protein